MGLETASTCWIYRAIVSLILDDYPKTRRLCLLVLTLGFGAVTFGLDAGPPIKTVQVITRLETRTKELNVWAS